MSIVMDLERTPEVGDAGRPPRPWTLRRPDGAAAVTVLEVAYALGYSEAQARSWVLENVGVFRMPEGLVNEARTATTR